MRETWTPGPAHGRRAWTWAVFVALASLGLSRVFACVTPFAAIAALGACTLPRRHAAALVLTVWLGNQAIGFGLLHYPHTSSTLGWGAAIGGACLTSLGAAWITASFPLSNDAARRSVAFSATYVAYEGVLLAATIVLPSGPGAFSIAVLLRVLTINAVAFALLTAVEKMAAAVGLSRRTGASQSMA